ncbi:hypothetical protein FQN50_008059 [Emmonsiellopsis sp. PD_5]|nr:hypothetical protein FQN50_008059 [Emmonsiellopsis sp. PD_5]
MIIEDVNHVQGIRNLSLVSKASHRRMLPFLYRKFTISYSSSTGDGWKLHTPIFVKTYFEEDGTMDVFNSLKFARDFEVVTTTDFSRLPHGEYCPRKHLHQDYLDPGCEMSPGDAPYLEKRMINSILATMRYLPKDSLRSFSWDLGCCVPPEILGNRGYVLATQSRITSLSLFDQGLHCLTHSLPPAGLFQLKHLQHFSWIGANVFEAYSLGLLDAVLNADFSNLESLTLAASWKSFRDVRDPLMFPQPNIATSLPKLRSLSLQCIDLWPIRNELATPTFISGLRTLKLTSCCGSLFLLGMIIRLNCAMNLRSFALAVHQNDYMEGEPHDSVERFLISFEGLEELHIHISVSGRHSHLVPTLDHGFIHHKETLRRLSYYHINPLDDDVSKYSGVHYRLPCYHLVGTICKELRLQNFGFSLIPSILKQQLGPIAAIQRFKFLYLRTTAPVGRQLMPRLYRVQPVENDEIPFTFTKTGRGWDSISVGEILEFAQWAFGPTGFPKLSIFAVGSFQPGGNSHITFCRRQAHEPSLGAAFPEPKVLAKYNTFRIMTAKDDVLWSDIEGGRDMLLP